MKKNKERALEFINSMDRAVLTGEVMLALGIGRGYANRMLEEMSDRGDIIRYRSDSPIGPGRLNSWEKLPPQGE